ncbi:MAG: permease-like cell division protein FtsX [bacterium]|nr:permease-like cell division protein FtsX [bacterium]
MAKKNLREVKDKAKNTAESAANSPAGPMQTAAVSEAVTAAAPAQAESEEITGQSASASATQPNNDGRQASKQAGLNSQTADGEAPPPPVLKPLPEQQPKLTITSKAVSVQEKGAASSNKFPSISAAAAPAVSAPAPLIGETEPAVKRYTPSGGYYVECFLREVVTNIRRNPMMSIASISTVMVLALILGLFTIVVANLDRLANELAGEMQIKVYMASTFPAEEAEECQKRILKIEHVTGAKFIPKDEAFASLRDRLGGRISLEDLEQNPLPDAYQVPVDDPQYLEQVAQQLHEITAVDKVDYGREEASKLLALNKAVRTVGFIILILLLASTVLIVSNTIRLTVFARRKEIDIMQLVGAADWFIRWPFILEGVAQGFIGAGLSALALDLGYRMVVPHFRHSIAFIPVIEPNEIMPYLCLGLALMGCAVGALGSLISVNRYLKA